MAIIQDGVWIPEILGSMIYNGIQLTEVRYVDATHPVPGVLVWQRSVLPLVPGGFNGGGTGGTANDDTAGGGGATDMRVKGTSLNHRVIVAGGGGSSGCTATIGGAGGGEKGGIGTDTNYLPVGQGGTQTEGGKGGSNSGDGTFGQGGHSGTTLAWPGGGGGGGWYGGGAGSNLSGGGSSGGGGSGYVGGCFGTAAQCYTEYGTQEGNGRATITRVSNGNVTTFNFTNGMQLFTAPAAGDYIFECWGAQGGNTNHGARGGYGGHSIGRYTLTAYEPVYVFVGEMGKNES